MSPQRPRVIFFFMNGCPHCERSWPAWDKAKGKLRKVADVEEKESREVSPDDGVSSFPTFVVLKGNSEVKRVEGARENPAGLIKELGLRRGSPRGRRTYRRGRQFTKRTLRNYKAL
jgi:thiol-disulfide isomerase/thioredoxin